MCTYVYTLYVIRYSTISVQCAVQADDDYCLLGSLIANRMQCAIKVAYNKRKLTCKVTKEMVAVHRFSMYEGRGKGGAQCIIELQ